MSPRVLLASHVEHQETTEDGQAHQRSPGKVDTLDLGPSTQALGRRLERDLQSPSDQDNRRQNDRYLAQKCPLMPLSVSALRAVMQVMRYLTISTQ